MSFWTACHLKFSVKGQEKGLTGRALQEEGQACGRRLVGGTGPRQLQHGRKSRGERREPAGFRQGPLYCPGQQLPPHRKEARQASSGASVQRLRRNGLQKRIHLSFTCRRLDHGKGNYHKKGRKARTELQPELCVHMLAGWGSHTWGDRCLIKSWERQQQTNHLEIRIGLLRIY